MKTASWNIQSGMQTFSADKKDYIDGGIVGHQPIVLPLDIL